MASRLTHNKEKVVMKVIVITGASSGFGALTARALAKAGHTVYAGMRDTTGRNARQVEEAKKFAKNSKVDLRTIELDVASQASVAASIAQAEERSRDLGIQQQLSRRHSSLSSALLR